MPDDSAPVVRYLIYEKDWLQLRLPDLLVKAQLLLLDLPVQVILFLLSPLVAGLRVASIENGH
jgi:hypothetical protein